MLPLERDAELTAIGELFEAALGGRGGLMLLEGAPGLGKSTLLAHAEDFAREHGLTVRRARGHELERAFAWGVARTLLEPSLGDEPARRRRRGGARDPASASPSCTPSTG